MKEDLLDGGGGGGGGVCVCIREMLRLQADLTAWADSRRRGTEEGRN